MFQFNREIQKRHFENHVAELHDFGKIKILDFYNPKSSAYSIRFLFEEDNYRLHITGDLGELIAENYKNMCFELFGKDFVDNPEYFRSKVRTSSRPLYEYDYTEAKKDLDEILASEIFLIESIDPSEISEYNEEEIFEKEEERKTEVIDEILEDFDERKGIGSKGYDLLSKYGSDFFECVGSIGREDTGILDLYLLAFELATKKLTENRTKNAS